MLGRRSLKNKFLGNLFTVGSQWFLNSVKALSKLELKKNTILRGRGWTRGSWWTQKNRRRWWFLGDRWTRVGLCSRGNRWTNWAIIMISNLAGS